MIMKSVTNNKVERAYYPGGCLAWEYYVSPDGTPNGSTRLFYKSGLICSQTININGLREGEKIEYEYDKHK